MERRSAEHLFLSRFSSDMPTEHIHTVRRLQERYGGLLSKFPFLNEHTNISLEQNGDSKSTSLLTQKIHSRMIRLEYKEKFIERELSLSLSIHRVVGLAARLLNFDPDDLRGIKFHFRAQ
jgi:hypothetical protein